MRGTLAERLNARLVPAPDTDCRLWTGCTNSRGYGVISDRNKRVLVHRAAWWLENGQIPDGLTIDHVWDRGCRYKNCALVAHLEPVTMAENIRRRRPYTRKPRARKPRRNEPSPEYLAALAAWLDGNGDPPEAALSGTP